MHLNEPPTPQHAEAAAETDCMTADVSKRDIGQAEREQLASEGRAVRNPDGHVSYPVASHSDAENALALIRSGHGDTAAAKRMLRRVARKEGWQDILDGLGGKKGGSGAEKAITAAGNPFSFPGGRNPMDRVSPPITEGHASPSTGDHGFSPGSDPMNQPGPRELAFRHPGVREPNSLRMDLATTTANPLAVLNAQNPAEHALESNIVGMYGAARVSMSQLDAAAASGLSSAPGNPAGRRMDHQSRGSAVAPNGSHSTAAPLSSAPMSVKSNSELRADFKRMLFPGSGGGR